MSISLRSSICISGSYEMRLEKKKEMAAEISDSLRPKNEFKGSPVVLREKSGSESWSPRPTSSSHSSIHYYQRTTPSQGSICIPRALRWWDRSMKHNMMEVRSTQELVDSLLNAGDRLVIVDFYSPGCGGCKALHPKVCQLAELHADAVFLKVNYEEHKSMCRSLRIHVLPFFRFYRGDRGRLCSFSCTNATIEKFKDALAKHGRGRCGGGPAKGLEESELLSLASDRSNDFSYQARTTNGKVLATTFLDEIELASV